MISFFMFIAATLSVYPDNITFPAYYWHFKIGIKGTYGTERNQGYELNVPSNIGTKCLTVTTGVSMMMQGKELSIYDNSECDLYRKTYMNQEAIWKNCGICNGFGVLGYGFSANYVLDIPTPIIGQILADTDKPNCPTGNYVTNYIRATTTDLLYNYMFGGANNVLNFGFRINQTDKSHIRGEWLDKLPTDKTAQVLYSIEDKKCTNIGNHWIKIQLDTFDINNCEIVIKPGECYKKRNEVTPPKPEKSEDSEDYSKQPNSEEEINTNSVVPILGVVFAIAIIFFI
ncbi:hypothetical protein EIN_104520 [Entamoeba invadens IP1]|uniref:Uncharacterized protein n=1 Tax=Entamoeba invadens IP1 TaxID=370355 RepID=L7FLJ4_ENTIV|nr:hypothetical protein EIN_104520 [Entamoeba invadens IP1]ELP88739.1 hypothetical protein EIN_104520 [Entamoeba invadens IP1]|eukprot:XP_004255510.1 hypothetical protein EIN_104520 [Entamoeba invadens IP1]